VKLPAISGDDAVQAFTRMGYEIDRQKGSHVLLRHPEPPHRRLSIPRHPELAKGTLRKLIREAGLSVDEFIQLL